MASNVFQTRLDMKSGGMNQVAAEGNKVAASITNIGTAAKGAQTNLRSLTGAFAALWAGRSISGLLTRALDPVFTYQKALTKLRLSMKGDAEGYKKMESAIWGASKAMGFGPSKVSEVMLVMYRSTKNTSEAVKGLTATLQIAQAMGRDMAPGKVATDITAPLIKRFGVEGAYAQFDKLAALSNAIGVDLKIFGDQTLQTLLVTSERTGIAFKDLAIGFVLAGKGGASASQNARGFATALVQLQKISPKLRQQLTSYGIGFGPGQSAKPGDIINYLAKAVGLGPQGFARAFPKLGGEAFYRGLMTLRSEAARQGISPGEMLGRLDKTWSEAGGGTSIRAQAFEGLPTAALERFQAAAERLAIVIGQKLTPTIETLLKWGSALGEYFGGSIKEGGIGGTLVGFVARIVAISGAILAGKAALWGYSKILSATRENVKGLGSGFLDFGSKMKNAWREAGIAWGIGGALWDEKNAGKAQAPAGSLDPNLTRNLKRPGASAAGSLSTSSRLARGLAGAMSAASVAGKALLSAVGGIPGVLLMVLSLLPEIIGVFEKLGKRMSEWYNKSLSNKEVIPGTGIKVHDYMTLAGKTALVMSKTNMLFRAMVPQTVLDVFSGKFSANLLNATKQETKIRVDSAKALQDAGRNALLYMQQGSSEWNDIMDKVAGIGKYRPPVVKMQQFGVARGALQSALASGRMTDEAKFGLHNLLVAEDLITTGKKRKLNPRETAQLRAATLYTSNILGRMVSGGLISEGIAKGYYKGVEQPMQIATSGPAIEAETAFQSALDRFMGRGTPPGREPYADTAATPLETALFSTQQELNESGKQAVKILPDLVKSLREMKDVSQESIDALNRALAAVGAQAGG